jgi:hypothetical protein
MKTMLCAVAVATGIFTAAASADGLPVVDVEVGHEGVTNPGLGHRYVTLPAGKNTLVARVERRSGRIQGFRTIPGRYTIPAVAYDGSAAGLSADGRSLALIVPRPGFPRAKTTFIVLDTATLRLRTTLALPGDFSFDAMSPDARSLYLIQYTSPDDPLQYSVRALDVFSGRLDPKPIVDPRSPGEAMNGHPLTRATSPDGRWAYTLYDGSEHPFVHALDTAGRSARCIDLDWLHGRKDLWRLRFVVSRDGRELSVRSGRNTVAVVDTRTFAATTGVERDDARQQWVFAVGGLAAALLASAVLYVVLSRRRASSTSVGGATSA